MDHAQHGALHHVELWVPDLDRAVASWGWLLTALGYQPFQDWPSGRSWWAADTYIVVEQSPDLTAESHDRCRPGLNHLAFHIATPASLDELTAAAQQHGWRLMFPDRHSPLRPGLLPDSAASPAPLARRRGNRAGELPGPQALGQAAAQPDMTGAD